MPIRLHHGRFQVLGFRFGDLAYCTDVNRIPDESWLPPGGRRRPGPRDALRHEPHPTHFNLDEALAAIDRLRPRITYLTHLSHVFDHEATEAGLPSGVRLAYDGFVLGILTRRNAPADPP